MKVSVKAGLSTVYAPLFWLGFIGLGSWMIAVRELPMVVLLPLFLLAAATSFLAERVLAYRPEWNRSHGDRGRDMAHALVNETLNSVSIAAIPLLAVWMPDAGWWPQHWPFWLQLLLAIVVADIGITLMHWLSHRVPLLWRLHAVHHSVTRMYGFNGLMKHPLHQSLEALAGTAPLLLLGMPVTVAAVLAFAIGIQLLLQHSNVDIRGVRLNRLMAWAPRHRFHHLKYGRAGDVNFGLFFTVWDHLLGTAFDGGTYRIGGSDLGIGGRPDYPVHYLAQLLEPLRRQVSESASPPLPEALRRGGGAGEAASSVDQPHL